MDNEILEQLKDSDRILLEQIKDIISKDEKILASVSDFVIDRVGKDNVSDLADLSSEEKIRTCLDHLAISLVSGDLRRNDIESVLKL